MTRSSREGPTRRNIVLQGLDNRIGPPGNGRTLRDQLGERVRLVEIPNVGHAFLFKQPQAVTEVIIAFLREHQKVCGMGLTFPNRAEEPSLTKA
jgi:pimeloyl-ACP methyl ester carboxylesterase